MGGLLAAGAFMWYNASPMPVPACDAPEITALVTHLFSSATIDAAAAVYPPPASAQMPPIPCEVKEVGFARTARVRACTGVADIQGKKTVFAFTVGAPPGEPGGMGIMGADPVLVRARFGNFDANGDFANQAQPIGRDNLNKAFRAGVAALSEGNTDAHPGRPSTLQTQLMAERLRDIAQLEPLAPCRESRAGLHYSCRLLVEDNEHLMAATGHGFIMLEDDFTFERDAAGKDWRVSAEFPKQYSGAVVKGRLAKLSGQAAPDDTAPKK